MPCEDSGLREGIGIFRLRMPTRVARRHASLKITEGKNGLLICPLMAEEFFDLVLLGLGHVEIFPGALGVVIR
jgi:hypothetical protein